MMFVLGVPLLFLAGDRYVGRIASIAEAEEDESANIRFDLWEAGFYMFLSRPVFGIGIMNFENAYGDGRYRVGKAKGYWSPHNIFIQIITETGIVGITAYLLIIFWIFVLNRYTRKYALRVKEKRRRLYDALTHGLDVALVGYVVAGQFITATYYPHLFQLAFLSSMLYLAARRDSHREKHDRDAQKNDSSELPGGNVADIRTKA
jgi:O-antigen ligase